MMRTTLALLAATLFVAGGSRASGQDLPAADLMAGLEDAVKKKNDAQAVSIMELIRTDYAKFEEADQKKLHKAVDKCLGKRRDDGESALYIGALETLVDMIATDMALSTDEDLQNARYVNIFLSDGIPDNDSSFGADQICGGVQDWLDNGRPPPNLDLLVANGRVRRGERLAAATPPPPWDLYAEPNLLYLNDGSGRFTLAGGEGADFNAPVEITRGEASEGACLIERAVNSARVSVRVRQVDELEEILTRAFCKSLGRRFGISAESCSLAPGRTTTCKT